MLFLLTKNDFGVRPEKIRKIYASAACRKSVMIGSDLNKSQMRKILDNMGTMDQLGIHTYNFYMNIDF